EAREPPLGTRPSYTIAPLAAQAGLSVAAMKIAEQFLRLSERGRHNDPTLEVTALLATTGLASEDLAAAIDELRDLGLVEPKLALGSAPFGYFSVGATEHLFLALDHLAMGWDTADDARRLATELLNSGHHWLGMHEIVERLQWSPRRINPALAFLIERGL